MDINSVVQIISTLGFPIFACVALGWYVKYSSDKNSKEVAEMRKEHQEEIGKVTEALQNNTLALQKLCDRLDVDREEN